MNGFRCFDLFDPSPDLCYRETSVFSSLPTNLYRSHLSPPFLQEHREDFDFALDLLAPKPGPFDLLASNHSPFKVSQLDLFESTTDLIQIHTRRFEERMGADLCLRSLCDRVSALERGYDRVLSHRTDGGDRKYTWSAEVKGPDKKSGVDKKLKLVAEIKGGEKCGSETAEKNYKWTAEIKGKGKDAPLSRTYTLTASTAPLGKCSKKPEKKKKDHAKSCTRMVEIEDNDHAIVALKQAFTKCRALADGRKKGKKKELSPQDAALLIQISFRAYLVRRSKTLSALRDLAIAKAKLKELRAFFSNISYRRLIAGNAEERQRFMEKIIVLLVTVETISASDIMVRAAKRSMLAELESMHVAVDPQSGSSLSLRNRKFDLPENGPVNRELRYGVTEVLHVLEQEDKDSESSAGAA